MSHEYSVVVSLEKIDEEYWKGKLNEVPNYMVLRLIFSNPLHKGEIFSLCSFELGRIDEIHHYINENRDYSEAEIYESVDLNNLKDLLHHRFEGDGRIRKSLEILTSFEI